MSTKRLINFYKKFLGYFGIDAEEEDKLIFTIAGGNVVCKADSKQLILPTEDNLRNLNPEQQIVFHPLIEHVNRSESPVISALRNYINLTINYKVLKLIPQLIHVCVSPELHAKLTPEQRELIKVTSNFDLKSAGNFIDAVPKVFENSASSACVNIFLKRAGTYRGQKFSRVGVVAFPIYDKIKAGELKLRNNDKTALANMFNYIFQDSETDDEAFNGTADDANAPWLNCLINTSLNLTTRFNEVVEIFRNFIEDPDELQFSLDWVNQYENISDLANEIRMIPAQRGNQGAAEEKPASNPAPQVHIPERIVNPPAPVAQVPVPQQPYVNQPVPQPYPPVNVDRNGQVRTHDGKVDFFASLNNNPQMAAAVAASMPPVVQFDQWGRPLYPPPMATGYENPAFSRPSMAGCTPVAPQVQFDQWGRPIPQGYMPQSYPQPMYPQPGYPAPYPQPQAAYAPSAYPGVTPGRI
jgi:hypothetical protein